MCSQKHLTLQLDRISLFTGFVTYTSVSCVVIADYMAAKVCYWSFQNVLCLFYFILFLFTF